MSIELKDIVEFTGIELNEEATVEDFKSAFNEKYVPSEQHGKKIKEINARAAHAINKSFRDAGFEVEKEELEKVDLFELPSVYANKVSSKLQELEGNKSATEEEISKKYQSEIEKYKSKVTDLSGLLEETKTGFESFKSEIQTKERNQTIGSYKSKSLSSLNWSDNANNIVKKGFEATLNERYKFELDDENKPIVRDFEGKLVQSKVKAGEAATYEEIIKTEFEALGDFAKKVDSKKVGNFARKADVTPPSNGGLQPARFKQRTR
jgi:hypothetical protein